MDSALRGRAAVWAVAAVVLVAVNLRGPLVALSPVAAEAQSDLAVSAGAIGLLTTLPVLCFGLAAPLGSLVIARLGLHRSVLACLAGILVGEVVRSAGGYPAALAGTVVIGVAITVGNIAMPVLIAEDFPAAVALVTALYTAAFNVGSTLAAGVTPLVSASTGWQVATAAWGVVAVVGALVVLRAQALRRPVAAADGADGAGAADGVAEPPAGSAAQGGTGAPDEPRPPLWRRPGTWGLTLAFGGQAFAYYGTTAWLPLLLGDELGLGPEAAGAAASVFQVAAVAGAFGVPLLLRLTGRPRVGLWAVCGLWLTLPAGLLTAPGAWPLWCALSGLAQGGGLVVVFVAVTARSRGAVEGRRTSAVVQGGGYALGATGPVLVGAAHDATQAWTVPLLVVTAAVLVLLVAGTPALGRRVADVPTSAPGTARRGARPYGGRS